MAKTGGSVWPKRAPSGLERERQLITEAIAMVALGAAPRVVVASLKHSRALLDPARHMALEAGVSVRAIWRGDGAGADLAVEPLDE
jgi:hypothetical protein